MTEEIFGPIVGIQEEALDLMNDTEYGLTGACISSDPEISRFILKNHACGSAFVNCADKAKTTRNHNRTITSRN